MKKVQLILVLAMVLFVFGCSSDNATSPADSSLDGAPALVGNDFMPGNPNDNPSIDPKDIQLSEFGLESLLGPDKFPSCIVFDDGYFIWNLNIVNGVVTGTTTRYDGAVWDVNGTGQTLNCTISDHVNYCDFVYYVQGIDKVNRTAFGTWQNTTCPGTGTWSGTGSPCK